MDVIRCDACGEFAWGTTLDDAMSGVTPDYPCDCGETKWRIDGISEDEADELGIDYVLADDPEVAAEAVSGEGLELSCPACGADVPYREDFDDDGVCQDCGEYYQAVAGV